MSVYWEGDGIRLYHGDCRDVLPTIPADSLAGVVTSPPYNMGDMSGGYANLSGGYATYGDQMGQDEYREWQRWVLTECWRATAETGAIFYNHKPRISGGALWTPLDLNPDLPLRQIIIWSRPGGMNWSETHLVPRHEWVLFFAKPKFRISKAKSSIGDVWHINPASGSDRPDHPAPFPIGLANNSITVLTESTKKLPILDPFAGSGTTLRAARDAGRAAIGIEIDERYCEVIARRLDQGAFDFGEEAS